jgi:hypothetical protein
VIICREGRLIFSLRRPVRKGDGSTAREEALTKEEGNFLHRLVEEEVNFATCTLFEKVGKIGEVTKAVCPIRKSFEAYTIVLKMQETAGNEYQGLSVGTAFDLMIYATQYTYEKDFSGDDQYDKIELPGVTMLNFDPDMLQAYKLDAGCAYMSVEEWDLLNWGYDAENDKVTEGTPEYAYYFVDFVVSFSRDHAAGEVGLWGYYEKWGEEETFTMDAITANTEYRVIEIAGEKLGIPMGSISYRQLLDDVKTFSCGVTENSLADGETMTVTLRMYKTALNGTSFAETGEFYDVAVYVYTK